MADFESMMESDGFSDPEDWLDHIMDKAIDDEQRQEKEDEYARNGFISKKSRIDIRNADILNKQNKFFLRLCTANNCNCKIVLKVTKRPHKYFWSCSSYPNCRKADDFYQNQLLDSLCEKCNSKLKIKFGKKGAFVGCSNYPNCKYTSDLPFSDIIDHKLYTVDNNTKNDVSCSLE
jgi:ssDNA-binding Zn-finger/Zn-ribbon topoisomerase 1